MPQALFLAAQGGPRTQVDRMASSDELALEVGGDYS